MTVFLKNCVLKRIFLFGGFHLGGHGQSKKVEGDGGKKVGNVGGGLGSKELSSRWNVVAYI